MTITPRNITVLKFGGSVLRSERDLGQLVHEVYRWVRRGQRVVAVVSAFEGRTDALLAQSQNYGQRLDGVSTATLVGTGELVSASTLSLALNQAGVPATVMTPASIGLRTRGPATDATAAELDAGAILRGLERCGVVVVPGFVGIDAEGNSTLLGRGGSDLTALFIAQQLGGVHCRLIKNVHGLYERDPALPGPPARCFDRLTWDHARDLGGGIVQPKAIMFARDHALAFEVAGLHRTEATVVGPGPQRHRPSPQSPERPLRVALLGAGTVGLGVYERLRALPLRFEVVAVACRDTARAARRGIDAALLTRDPLDAATRPCDIVVEALGGLDAALSAVEHAIRAGDRDVVTANKSLIARHGVRLRAQAEERGRRLRCSGAVGGACPVLECIGRLRADGPIRSIRGVINGTTNYVLDEIASGRSLALAVRAAQEAGFSEADPSRDLEGWDAAEKLTVMAQEAFGIHIEPTEVVREALLHEPPVPSTGSRLRQVARCERLGDRLVASVRLEAITPGDALHGVTAEDNAVMVESDTGSHLVRGRGAGKWPTAEAVVADLLDLARAGTLPTVGSCAGEPDRAALAGAVPAV